MPKAAKKEVTTQGICAQSNCRFVHFWHRWGSHFDLAGGCACLSMLAGIIYFGVNFVHDTQAYGPELKKEHHQVALSTARLDRMDGNMEMMMRAMHLKPLKKTDTEIQLEHEGEQEFDQ